MGRAVRAKRTGSARSRRGRTPRACWGSRRCAAGRSAPSAAPRSQTAACTASAARSSGTASGRPTPSSGPCTTPCACLRGARGGGDERWAADARARAIFWSGQRCVRGSWRRRTRSGGRRHRGRHLLDRVADRDLLAVARVVALGRAGPAVGVLPRHVRLRHRGDGARAWRRRRGGGRGA